MADKPRIICIGAAVQDVYLQGKLFQPQHEEEGDVEEFKLGSKNDVENVIYSTGGGATNAAVTFARQGMHAAYMGYVGEDIASLAVRQALREEHVDYTLLQETKKFGTGYSVLMLAPNGERTILTYRGASAHFDLEKRDFRGKTADWFYISNLAGNFKTLRIIFDYAAEHDIKIAINPGKKELAEPDKLNELLEHCTILSANKEELAQLFGGDSLEASVKAASKLVPYVVGTDGPKGCLAADQQKLYQAGMYADVKVVDRNGAGDAFCSGFTAMIALEQTMEHALTFASANSTSVVEQIGAKTGILRSHTHLHDMPIKVTDL